jgi:HicB family
VRPVTRVYDRRTLSAQPSPSAVEEAGRERPTSPSGRLLLRMPPGLHGELAREAERQGSSLNGYIIARLTESVGWSDAPGDVRSTGHRDGQMLTWLLVANVVAVAIAGLAAVAILLFAL